MNSPEWSDKFSYAVRLEYGRRMDGIHCKGWYYDGWLGALDRRELSAEGEVVETRFRQRVRMMACGAYYAHERMYFEVEGGARWFDGAEATAMRVGYVHVSTRFPSNGRRCFSNTWLRRAVGCRLRHCISEPGAGPRWMRFPAVG